MQGFFARRTGLQQKNILHYRLIEFAEWSGEKGVDVVIETAGAQGSLALAGEMVRAHGTLSILGYHQDGPREVDMKMWNWKGLDVVNAHVRRPEYAMESMRMGLSLVAAGQFSLAPLISHSFALDQVDAAFSALEEKAAGFTKAVILF